jgi:hypothetical protein
MIHLRDSVKREMMKRAYKPPHSRLLIYQYDEYLLLERKLRESEKSKLVYASIGNEPDLVSALCD